MKSNTKTFGSGESTKSVSLLLLFCLISVITFSQGSKPNLLYNNGALIFIRSGTLVHVQGDVVNATSGGTFINDGLLNVEGDFTNNGTFTTDGNVGEGTVRLIGNNTWAGSTTTGVQTISGNWSVPGTASFYNLVIDGQEPGQVTSLSSNITVTGSLVWNGSSTAANTYNPYAFPTTLGSSTIMQVRGSVPSGNGTITTSSQQIYIPSSAPTSLAGYGSTSYINGYLQRGVAPAQSYDLPVGSGSNYELANIQFSNHMLGTSFLTANFNTSINTEPVPSTCIINGQPIGSWLDAGYWTIHPDNQPVSGYYAVTLSMRGYSNEPSTGTNSSGGTVTPGQQIGVVKRANSSSPWIGSGPTVSGNVSTDQGTGICSDNGSFTSGVAWVQRNIVPVFSDFGIGVGEFNNVALPVQMLSLTAEPVDNEYIRVAWATASELDNKGFEVMRSDDGVNFTQIGWVDGHGTTSFQNDYSYKDKNVLPNITYYYRLNQINTDGRGTQTNIVSASLTGNPNMIISELMPNPTSGQARLLISTTTEAEQVAAVRFYDILGRVVLSRDNNLILPGINTLDFDMSSYAAATYTAVIRIGDNVYSRKVVLVK